MILPSQNVFTFRRPLLLFCFVLFFKIAGHSLEFVHFSCRFPLRLLPVSLAAGVVCSEAISFTSSLRTLPLRLLHCVRLF